MSRSARSSSRRVGMMRDRRNRTRVHRGLDARKVEAYGRRTSSALPSDELARARRAREGGRCVLLALWSPKGGSGTSVLAAAAALVLARGPAGGCRLADLDGDQPAIFGFASEPELGLLDWLAAGPETPSEALDRLAVEVALRDGSLPVVVDCGRAVEPAARAVTEVADAAVVVVRGCYLALRRAVGSG